ncbi:MAG: hypothetical protein ABIE84_05535 [bacterium]
MERGVLRQAQAKDLNAPPAHVSRLIYKRKNWWRGKDLFFALLGQRQKDMVFFFRSLFLALLGEKYLSNHSLQLLGQLPFFLTAFVKKSNFFGNKKNWPDLFLSEPFRPSPGSSL